MIGRRGRTRMLLTLRVGLMISACLVALPCTAIQLGLMRVPAAYVGERELSAGSGAIGALRRKAALWQDRSLTLRVGYHLFRPSRAELGWELRVADIERQLDALGRSPNPLIPLRALWIGLLGRGHPIRWRPRVRDANALPRYVELIRTQVERLPVPGTYGPDGAPMEGIAGEAFDTVAAQQAIARALLRGDHELSIPTLLTAPPSGYRHIQLASAHLDVLMRTQETSFISGSGRANNIELAARAINEHILPPGGRFSFNQVVGKRTRSRGFSPALELSNGELTLGIGGGVCQVAGTLHAAAFFAGLIVEEYHAHSRLSRLAYLPPGLDAMVSWPDHVSELEQTADMRLRNPYPFPVRIAATIAPGPGRRKRLRLQLYGSEPPFRVVFSFEPLAQVPAREVTRPDPDLPVGSVRVQQRGLDGLVIARHRTTYTPYGQLSETTRVSYPATPRIVRVGTALP